MVGVLKEAKLTKASARSKLPAGIHWRAIDAQTHLGYRRRERVDGSGMAGHWFVRWYIERPKYRQEMIGAADDALDADGIHTFDYYQAERQARKIVQTRRAEAIAEKAGPAVTVRMAVEEYLAGREDRERSNAGHVDFEEGEPTWLKRDARSRLTRYVLTNENLTETKLAVLTEADLAGWRDGLPDIAASTVRRLANDFKAALNRAATKYRDRLPDNLATIIKNGLAVRQEDAGSVARPDQVLPDEDVRRILAAARDFDAEGEWEGDLFRIICVLAATGARFSQIVRMTVADVQPEHGRLMVPVSHKGRGNKAARHTPVQVGDDVIAALRAALAGRKKAEALFLRPHWQRFGPRERVGRGPWKVAAEITRPWQEIVKRAGLPTSTIPYALRHSSIVRGIRAGLPIRLVASIHDTSTAMIERHYAAFIASAMDELARRAVMPGLVPATAGAKVIELRA